MRLGRWVRLAPSTIPCLLVTGVWCKGREHFTLVSWRVHYFSIIVSPQSQRYPFTGFASPNQGAVSSSVWRVWVWNSTNVFIILLQWDFVIGGLWGLITRSGSTPNISGSSIANGGEVTTDGPSDFSAQALLLLLVLANHCSGSIEKTSWSNPYRQALLSFTDSQGSLSFLLVLLKTLNSIPRWWECADPVQVSPVHPAACFRLDYSVLYGTLCDRLSDERTTLLLYMLLHQHQQFRLFVYTHADIQRMVLRYYSNIIS